MPKISLIETRSELIPPQKPGECYFVESRQVTIVEIEFVRVTDRQVIKILPFKSEDDLKWYDALETSGVSATIKAYETFLIELAPEIRGFAKLGEDNINRFLISQEKTYLKAIQKRNKIFISQIIREIRKHKSEFPKHYVISG